MTFPNKALERKLCAQGYNYIIAVDEVGMGCLAGPVVVCAVRLSKDFFEKNHDTLRGLRESKLLSAQRRDQYATALMKLPGLKYQISYCYPRTIDRLNIYQASRLAMRRVVRSLAQSKRVIILVDGPRQIASLPQSQLAIVGGDRKIFAIACASIIAKVHRDKTMLNYAKRYPNYGFEKHKGYGTRLHQTQLATLGPTPIHRRSFTPVARLG